jgi:REP element-mobilizing transposase RayT
MSGNKKTLPDLPDYSTLTNLARAARTTDAVMSNYRRVYLPGGMNFFTVVTFRRQRFLTDNDVRAALREGIQFTRQTKPFEIVAWVLLLDHLHCIWRLPPDDSDFSSRWSIIKRIVTQRCGGTSESPALVDRPATQATA